MKRISTTITLALLLSGAAVAVAQPHSWECIHHSSLSEAEACFTTETPAECDEVLKMYQTGAAPAGSFTRGLYYRTLK